MHDQPSSPRRSDLAAAVSSTEQFRAHGAELHVALRCHDHNHAGRLTTDSVCRAQRHGIPLIEGAAGAFICVAGWSSWLACRSHKPEVVGSSPTPATNARSCGSPVGGAHPCPSDREMASSRTRPQHRTPGKTFVLLGVTAGETAPSFCAMGGHGDPHPCEQGLTLAQPPVGQAWKRHGEASKTVTRSSVAGSTPASRTRSAIRNTAVTGKTGQRQTGRSAILRVNADVTGGERPAPYSGSPVVEPTP